MFQWCPTCPTMTREMDKCQEKDEDQKMDLGQYLKMIRNPERDKDPPDETWWQEIKEIMMKTLPITEKDWKVTDPSQIYFLNQ